MGARVFVSCGQARYTNEDQIAQNIAHLLCELGFEPYVAVAEQSLVGLKENVFARLRNSEYFVFVDFKRELLIDASPQVHRGSLFAHQELAIAAFMELDAIALRENGVKWDDGILPYVQANAIPFTDRHTLPAVIASMVSSRGWAPDWRNELKLERDRDEYTNAQAISVPGQPWARYFHVDVWNRHREKAAANC